MSELKIKLSDEECGYLREFVALDAYDAAEGLAAPSLRIWGPINVREATGRSHCRACGQIIPQGEEAIRFGFDNLGGKGHLAQSFVHLEFCPPETLEEGDAASAG